MADKKLEISNTKLINLTTYPSNLVIRRQENNFLDLSFTNGVRVKVIDNQQTIIIQLNENLANDRILSGLCGDCNNNQDDDLKLFASNTITSNPIIFGNQWRLYRNVKIIYFVLSKSNFSFVFLSVPTFHQYEIIV